jgi:membrane-associated phospholipid phosphatase
VSVAGRRSPGRIAGLHALVTWLLVLAAVSPALAQEPEPQPQPAAATAPLLGATDAYFAAGAALGTLALAPLDARLARAFQDTAARRPPAIRIAATAAEIVGGPGTLVLAGSMYAFGNIVLAPELATTGLRTAEAVVLAEILVYGLKGLTGRARPRVPGAGPLDFGFGRGITSGSYRSFPSGHTAAAFAAATVLNRTLADRHPDARVVTGSLLYGGAAFTALARIYNSEHWLSDTALGAAIGTYSGWKVLQFHDDRPEGTRIDRLLLSVTLVGGRPTALSITPVH